MSSIIRSVRQLAGKHRDEFTGGDGVHTPLDLARWGAGGCHFHDKAEKYEKYTL